MMVIRTLCNVRPNMGWLGKCHFWPVVSCCYFEHYIKHCVHSVLVLCHAHRSPKSLLEKMCFS